MTAFASPPTTTARIATANIISNPFSISIYGEPDGEIGDLMESVKAHGVLVPLVVVPSGTIWEVVSGHRRLACAQAIGLTDLPCEIRSIAHEDDRRHAILEYNRQRRKSFSQLMREADALETLLAKQAKERSQVNLRRGPEISDLADRRNSDDRNGRTDSTIARAIGMGGKDLYRQARAIWRKAQTGDPRAKSGVEQLDAGTKTIHAAYKDLRRRDRFSSGFRPTPYDVWSFKHDRAFGIPHPGSIPPGIVAHTLYYFTEPGALVVDPMAGGGTTIDVCESMGRKCLAYDIAPVRPEVVMHDVRTGLPPEATGCDLVFCDPPYHTMLARRYSDDGVASEPLSVWTASWTLWLAIPSRLYVPEDGLRSSSPTRPRRICRPAMDTSTTLIMDTTPSFARASSPSDGSVARWMAPTSRSTSVEHDSTAGCSARFATSSSRANPRLDTSRERFAAREFVDLAADEGIAERGIASDDRLGELGHGSPD